MTGFTPNYEDDAVAFEISVEAGTEPPLITLRGEMDLRAAADLRETLLRALAEGGGSLVLDLSGLTFLDSTIISVLIMARKRAEVRHGEVTLRRVPKKVLRLLAITGIESLFSFETTEELAPDQS